MISHYLSSLETKNYSANTIEAYRRIIEDYVGCPCRSVGHYLTMRREERHLSPSSLHLYISALTSYYRYLVSQGVVNTNPMDDVERPKLKEREVKYLHHEEVKKLLKSIPNPLHRLIVRLIYMTGMRVSEATALRAEDIDYDNQAIRVRGKGGKIRIAFCDEDTLNMIREYMNHQGIISGRLWATTRYTLAHVLHRLGTTPHQIRHSYASTLYKRSHDLRLVQETLGHSSIQTTQIYVHADVDERRKAYQEYFPRL